MIRRDSLSWKRCDANIHLLDETIGAEDVLEEDVAKLAMAANIVRDVMEPMSDEEVAARRRRAL